MGMNEKENKTKQTFEYALVFLFYFVLTIKFKTNVKQFIHLLCVLYNAIFLCSEFCVCVYYVQKKKKKKKKTYIIQRFYVVNISILICAIIYLCTHILCTIAYVRCFFLKEKCLYFSAGNEQTNKKETISRQKWKLSSAHI